MKFLLTSLLVLLFISSSIAAEIILKPPPSFYFPTEKTVEMSIPHFENDYADGGQIRKIRFGEEFEKVRLEMKTIDLCA